jgi:tRNA-binding EMAP/Myf-like protein
MIKPPITSAELDRIDVRVGTILAVDDVPGSEALFVVNLEPRRMRGVVSEGMLFDIGYADGIRPVLAVPEAPVPDGTRAG